MNTIEAGMIVNIGSIDPVALKLLIEERNALIAELASIKGQEPVAWRSRYKNGPSRDREWEMWNYSNDAIVQQDHNIVEPLFLAAGAQPKGTHILRTPAGYTFEDARRDGVFGPAHDICPTWYATTLRKEGWDAASSAAKEQQRNPLTDEEVKRIACKLFSGCGPSDMRLARAIEAAHGIKE